jgi:hypothetical protein
MHEARQLPAIGCRADIMGHIIRPKYSCCGQRGCCEKLSFHMMIWKAIYTGERTKLASGRPQPRLSRGLMYGTWRPFPLTMLMNETLRKIWGFPWTVLEIFNARCHVMRNQTMTATWKCNQPLFLLLGESRERLEGRTYQDWSVSQRHEREILQALGRVLRAAKRSPI